MPDSVPIPIGSTTHTLHRRDIEAAASRLEPAHSSRALEAKWYALVGGGLHYVRPLIAAVTNETPKVDDARQALAALGFSVFCLADDDLLNNGIPWHRGY
ncbi:hypothetical protein [Streptomyces sp. NPDC089799]|uniref:hypothetical protein n=1 Tax=Streptomyces sp. NPDC089799 TaxID=3155066 RepID=UPI0034406FE9